MAKVEFADFIRVGLKALLKKRADEIVRARFSKDFYETTDGGLRSQSEIDEFMNRLDPEIESIVEEYILQLGKTGLLSPENIRRNPEKVVEITLRMEKELKKRMKK